MHSPETFLILIEFIYDPPVWIILQYEDTKGYCEDITEGKFSYPIIHAVNSGDAVTKYKILEILKQRTSEITLKKEMVELLQGTGSLEYTKHKLLKLQMEIKMEIAALGGNAMLEEILVKILSFWSIWISGD